MTALVDLVVNFAQVYPGIFFGALWPFLVWLVGTWAFPPVPGEDDDA